MSVGCRGRADLGVVDFGNRNWLLECEMFSGGKPELVYEFEG